MEGWEFFRSTFAFGGFLGMGIDKICDGKMLECPNKYNTLLFCSVECFWLFISVIFVYAYFSAYLNSSCAGSFEKGRGFAVSLFTRLVTTSSN